MYWYNPKSRVTESVPAPHTDEEAKEMLRGHVTSCAFLTEYDKLRADGMPIEQAIIFVGHHFRLRHLEFQPARKGARAQRKDPRCWAGGQLR